MALDHIDYFLDRYRNNLTHALGRGLTDQAAVSACVDLAETRAVMNGDYFYADIFASKIQAWDEAVDAALAVERLPRTVHMELDPEYFQAMLCGRKTIEGRAYDPGSNKNYPDIRAGDLATYTLSQRNPAFAAQLGAMGLQSGLVMVRPVAQVHFAPTVASMYETVGEIGEHFQPMLSGIHNALARIAVYHGFPNYSERIGEHGFLGIEHPSGQIELHQSEAIAT